MKNPNKKAIPTNPHNSRKHGKRGPQKGAIYIPPAQQEKMKEMFLNGQFISAIAKETGRDCKTVAKIVRSADMVRYMDQCRVKAQELIPDILEMVHKEMRKAPNKDRVRAGIDYLTRARVFEERQMPVQAVPVMQVLETEEQDRREVKKMIEGFAEMAIETHRLFGLEMPELALVRGKLEAGWRTGGNENLSEIQRGHQQSSTTSVSPLQPRPLP